MTTMTEQLHGKNIIGGATSAQGKDTFRAYDPTAGAPIEPMFHDGTTREVDAALQLAAGAFEAYRQVSPDRRAAFLEAVADAIMELGEPLLERALAETGLPVKPRLEAERARTVFQLRMFADVLREGSWVGARIDTANPDRKPPKPDLRRMLVALGPAAVFGASNFPFAYSVAGGDTASALAAGCPVIAKAHPAHPGTSELVGRAIAQAVEQSDMPAGVFSMIHGRSNDVGMALVTHPLTCAVGFTGSLRGGRALFDAAAKRAVPIPVYAEMGSTNPVFILPGALKLRGTQIAHDLAASVTLGVGQFCTNPGLVVSQRGAPLDGFFKDLSQKIADTPPATMLHPGIRDAFVQGTDRLRNTGGVGVVAESKHAVDEKKTQARAHVFTTSVETFMSDRAIGEEVFGPSTVVVQADTVEHLEQFARELDGHLTASVHGTDEDFKQFADLIAILETKVGRLIFNGYPTGVEVCASMVHGGPYPATTDSRTTSVGSAAISRFARPVSYQDCPQPVLPPELRDENERGIWRLVNDKWTKDAVG